MAFIRFRQAVAAAALAWALGAPAAAQTEDPSAPLTLAEGDGLAALDDIHSDVFDRRDLQTELPGPFTPEPSQRRTRSGFGDWLSGVFQALGPVVRVLFWGVVIALAGMIVFFILREMGVVRLPALGRKKGDRTQDDRLDPLRPDAATARSLLEEADALAAAGRYAEAARLLLFRSIEDIQTRRPGAAPRSYTAREIGRLAFLPEAARAALTPIIQVVEHSFFGGRAVDADDWRGARSSYETFAFGGAWS